MYITEVTHNFLVSNLLSKNLPLKPKKKWFLIIRRGNQTICFIRRCGWFRDSRMREWDVLLQACVEWVFWWHNAEICIRFTLIRSASCNAISNNRNRNRWLANLLRYWWWNYWTTTRFLTIPVLYTLILIQMIIIIFKFMTLNSICFIKIEKTN